jgi:hypothetical protein
MDRFDKHRELVIINSCANVAILPSMGIEAYRILVKYSNRETRDILTSDELALARRIVNQDAVVTPQVAFAKIGKREGQFVVPSLMQLFNAIMERIDMFASLT